MPRAGNRGRPSRSGLYSQKNQLISVVKILAVVVVRAASVPYDGLPPLPGRMLNPIEGVNQLLLLVPLFVIVKTGWHQARPLDTTHVSNRLATPDNLALT